MVNCTGSVSGLICSVDMVQNFLYRRSVLLVPAELLELNANPGSLVGRRRVDNDTVQRLVPAKRIEYESRSLNKVVDHTIGYKPEAAEAEVGSLYFCFVFMPEKDGKAGIFRREFVCGDTVFFAQVLGILGYPDCCA